MRKGILALAALAAAASSACGVTPDTPLSKAAAEGRTEEVASLISAGVEVDASDGSGLTALTWAARHGQVETLRALLRSGASPNLATGHNGWPPLVHAIHTGQNEAAIELLESGADVQGPGGRRGLLMAAGYGNASMVRELLARGADPHSDGIMTDAVGGAWDIDYQWPGCGPHTEAVRALLEAAPDLRLGDGFWARRALSRARKRGCAELVELVERRESADRVARRH